MKKVTRFGAAFAAAAMIIVFLSSCSGPGPAPSDGRTVLTIGGTKINYDLYRYVFLNTRDDMDGGDHTVWQGDYAAQAELNDAVLEVLTRNTAIEKLAAKYGIKLSADEKREAADAVAAKAAVTGSDGKTGRDLLEDAHMTEYAAYYVSCFTSLWGKIYNHVTNEENGILRFSDEELISAVPEKFTCISYVYIPRDKENALQLALEASEKISGGADFGDIVTEYGSDPDMSARLEHGYYYVEGEIIDGVADEAAALGPGETSGVIDLGQGYFIIRRLPVDMDYVRSDLSTFRTKYLAHLFNVMVDETAAGLDVKYGKPYASLTVETVK